MPTVKYCKCCYSIDSPCHKKTKKHKQRVIDVVMLEYKIKYHTYMNNEHRRI